MRKAAYCASFRRETGLMGLDTSKEQSKMGFLGGGAADVLQKVLSPERFDTQERASTCVPSLGPDIFR